MNAIRMTGSAVLLAGWLLTAGGCGGNGGTDSGATSRPAAGGADLSTDELELPTEEEAAAEAADSIGEENADEVFDQLSREIEEELGEEP